MTDAAQFALTHGAAILFAWILAQQAGAPIPAAPVLNAVGSLASSRRLGLASSLIASFSACLLANGLWYQVGRQGLLEGHRFGRPNGEWQARALKLMRGHSPTSMLLAKFVAGSNFASLLAGRAGVSATRFLAYESICSLTWSGTCIAAGYLSRSTALDAGADFLPARIAVFLGRVWYRRSLAHAAILAVATLFFCVLRPVSQYKLLCEWQLRLFPRN